MGVVMLCKASFGQILSRNVLEKDRFFYVSDWALNNPAFLRQS